MGYLRGVVNAERATWSEYVSFAQNVQMSPILGKPVLTSRGGEKAQPSLPPGTRPHPTRGGDWGEGPPPSRGADCDEMGPELHRRAYSAWSSPVRPPGVPIARSCTVFTPGFRSLRCLLSAGLPR